MTFPITRNTFFHLEQAWHEAPRYRPVIVLAAAIAAIASPILLLADGARWAYRSLKGIPSADYHYFFSTEIFSCYVEQLKIFIKNETTDHPSLSSLDLVQWIQKPIQNKELFYRGIVSRLRDLASKKDRLDQETAEFVERFCHWIYTGPNLLPAMSDWIKSHMTQEEKAALSKEMPHQVIQNLHKRWSSTSRFQGEVFQDYRPYDPRQLGDTPSHFFRVGSTQIIRTPAVTRDNKRKFFGTLTEAAVVEEFQGFLQHYQRQGKTHLYVNLMASNRSEKVRNQALEELERKTPSHFHLITLSKDCAFYHQAGHFAHQDRVEFFKETFLQQMFGDNGAFHWPISWNPTTTQAICNKAIEQVHERHFGSALFLNREQRCNFIELAYTEILEMLLHYQNPTTCNLSCRSCVDRGAANLSLLYARVQPLQDHKSRETLATIALAPAMISQSRQMLSHRMQRLLPALKLLVQI